MANHDVCHHLAAVALWPLRPLPLHGPGSDDFRLRGSGISVTGERQSVCSDRNAALP